MRLGHVIEHSLTSMLGSAPVRLEILQTSFLPSCEILVDNNWIKSVVRSLTDLLRNC